MKLNNRLNTILSLLTVLVVLLLTPLGDSYLLSLNLHVIELNTNAYYFWPKFSSEVFNYTFILLAPFISFILLNQFFNNYFITLSIILIGLGLNGITVTYFSYLLSLGILLQITNKKIISYVFALTISFISLELTSWVIVSYLFLTISLDKFSYKSKEFLFLSLIFLISLFSNNTPLFLDTPVNASFVPTDGYLYGLDPIIGERPEAKFINLLKVEDNLTKLIYFILSFLFISLFTVKQIIKNQLKWFLVCCLLIASASSIFPNWINLISPISTLSRILPNATLFPISLIITGILLASGIKFLNNKQVFTFFVITFLFWSYSINYNLENKFGFITKKISLPSSAWESPSLYLLKNSLPLPIDNISPITLNNQNSIITASINNDKINNIFSDKKPSRWSTKPNQQNGSEWIKIILKNPTYLKGFELLNDNFVGDYPRGVEIYLSDNESCENQILVYKEPIWRGTVRKTQSNVYYLDSLNQASYYFNNKEHQEINTKCIFLKQTGKDLFYEWSIEKINLLK